MPPEQTSLIFETLSGPILLPFSSSLAEGGMRGLLVKKKEKKSGPRGGKERGWGVGTHKSYECRGGRHRGGGGGAHISVKM